MAKSKVKLSDEVVEKICEYIRDGLSHKHACAQAGVNHRTLHDHIDGDEPKNPAWRLLIDQADAWVVKYWIDYMEEAGNREKGNGSAAVKAAETMLAALDGRFRKDSKETPTGMQVVFYLGEPDAPARIVTSELVRPKLTEG